MLHQLSMMYVIIYTYICYLATWIGILLLKIGDVNLFSCMTMPFKTGGLQQKYKYHYQKYNLRKWPGTIKVEVARGALFRQTIEA